MVRTNKANNKYLVAIWEMFKKKNKVIGMVPIYSVYILLSCVFIVNSEHVFFHVKEG